MKFIINYYTLFVILIFFSFKATSTFTTIQSQVQPQEKFNTMHISVNLSDKLNAHFEKYILYAYNQLGFKVSFEKILPARAREMFGAGQLDAKMIAEKEIEQVYNNILRVPVMLYCNKQVDCQLSALSSESNVVGVVSGNSLSGNYMRKMRASTYAVKG